MKIIIDAMGGDFAPEAPVRGGLQAAKEFGVQILFTGDESAIRRILKQDGYDTLPENIEIVNCTQTVDNCDDPSTVWRKKPDSSMTVGLKLLKASRGNAFVSAGSTGALLSGATLLVRRIRGSSGPPWPRPCPPARVGRCSLTPVPTASAMWSSWCSLPSWAPTTPSWCWAAKIPGWGC